MLTSVDPFVNSDKEVTPYIISKTKTKRTGGTLNFECLFYKLRGCIPTDQ